MWISIDTVEIDEQCWEIEYDKDRNMYRVSYFEDNHWKHDVIFEGVEWFGTNEKTRGSN